LYQQYTNPLCTSLRETADILANNTLDVHLSTSSPNAAEMRDIAALRTSPVTVAVGRTTAIPQRRFVVPQTNKVFHFRVRQPFRCHSNITVHYFCCFLCVISPLLLLFFITPEGITTQQLVDKLQFFTFIFAILLPL